jgi:hypothetical protein
LNQEQFYLANQVDGQLTDAQTMQMLDLPEGDRNEPKGDVQSNEPAVAEVPVVAAAEVEVKPVEAEQKPVIAAKDGVHTIPYEKLTEAREAEQHWKRVATEAQQQLEAHKATPAVAPTETPAKAETPVLDGDIFGDFSEGAIAQGVEKLVASRTAAIEAKFDAKLASVLEPLQQKQVESAADSHFSAINAAHPDVESVVQSAELANWIASQPSFARAGYQAAIAQGTAAEVIEALDAYKAATGKLTAAPGKPDAAVAAQAAIAKAQAAVPLSLSEIPAGSHAHADESAAMLDMSSAGLMTKFDGKTPEQIRGLMNKLL